MEKKKNVRNFANKRKTKEKLTERKTSERKRE